MDVKPTLAGITFAEILGKGSSGTIYNVQYEQKNFGCKVISKDLKSTISEIRCLKALANHPPHPNIIAVHSILQSGDTVFILMQNGSTGSLFDYVKKHGAVSESRACFWFFQIVSAIKYLHSMNYAHQDLKCENILISKKMNIKVSDFGFARCCIGDDNEKIMSKTFCGTTGFKPPEIVSGTAYDPMKSDVWSLGVILFNVLNGFMPFDDSNMRKLIRDQNERRYHIREELIDQLSPECKHMIHTLLEPNPIIRANINKIHGMPWLRKHSGVQVLSKDVGSSRERQLELHLELQDVNEQLGNGKNDKHEDARRKKKQEVVELFKREIPGAGVYDRMINMCQPTDKRYNVAVTKVLEKYMESIIVDTAETGAKCIQMLKDHQLEIETFLPLDYLQVIPLKERLRNIRSPKGVHLIYDVLRFDPPDIKRAVLFATNNALVCESPEDAMKVAKSWRKTVIFALDGKFYK